MAHFYGVVAMSLQILFWKNLRKRKAYSLVIFLLMTLVSFTLICATTTFVNVNHHLDDSLASSNAPAYMNWIASEQVDATWLQALSEHELVDHVDTVDLVAIPYSAISLNTNSKDNNMFLKQYDPSSTSYLLQQQIDSSRTPEDGAIYLPYAFQESYQCKIGDTITISFAQTTQSFVIQDFYEDPIAGNMMYGMKFILFSADDFDALMKQVDGKISTMLTQVNLHVTNIDDVASTLYEINEDVPFYNNGMFAYALSFFTTTTRLIPSLMLMFIMGFSALMFLITLLVLAYTLKAAISEDTVEIGIMKAVGFHEKQITHLLYLQYISIAFLAFLLGMAGSFFVLIPLEEMVLSSSGSFVSGQPQPLLIIGIGAFLMSCIYLLMRINTRSIRKISSVTALSSKTSDIYFSSFINIPMKKLNRLPLSWRMSFKHVVTHVRQYVTILLIAVLLCECLLTVLSINAYFQKDGMRSITGGMDADIYMYYANEQDYEKALSLLDEIQEREPIALTYRTGSEYLLVNGTQLNTIHTEVFDEAYVQPPLEGRFPIYDNEIMVTELMLTTFQKNIGDTIDVATKQGIQKEFLIVGAHQTFNEMGKQCMITSDGFARLGLSKLGQKYNIQFQQRGQQASLVNEFNEILMQEGSTLRLTDEQENVKEYAEAEQIAIIGITVLIIVSSAVLIGLISFLLAKIAIEKERTDFAILYFQGFTIRQLRQQFSLRYSIVAMLGASIGIIFNLLTNSFFMSYILSSVGVTRFSNHYTMLMILTPMALLTFLTYSSAWITTRKIKNINVQSITNGA